MVEIPEVFRTPEFKRLFLLAKIGNFTPDEYKEYQKSLDNMSDYYNIIDSAEKRARAEGILEGEIRGREEAKLEDAAKLKQLGVSVEIISLATGLSVENIEKL